MRDPNQQFIFNDEELSLIKNTFSENEPLLYSVRKVLLQFPLTDAEKGLIKLSMTPEVVRVLRKRILPDVSDEFPLTQLSSLLTTLGEHLKVKDVSEMAPQFAAKKLEIDYLAQQFAVLSDVDAAQDTAIRLADLGVITADVNETYVKMTAYLYLLGYIDPMLTYIKSIAGAKAETVDQAKKRMERNSSK